MQKNGKYNRHTTDIGRIKIFRGFLKGEDISFSEITVNLINRFKAWLKSTCYVSERMVVNYLFLIRTIYNQAAKSGITGKANYPFGKDKVVIKFPDSIKIGLTEEEVRWLPSPQNFLLQNLHFLLFRTEKVVLLYVCTIAVGAMDLIVHFPVQFCLVAQIYCSRS